MHENNLIPEDAPHGACHILSTSIPVQGNIPGPDGIIKSHKPEIAAVPLLITCVGPDCPFRMWDEDRSDCSQRPESSEQKRAKNRALIETYSDMMMEYLQRLNELLPKCKQPDLSKSENIEIG